MEKKEKYPKEYAGLSKRKDFFIALTQFNYLSLRKFTGFELGSRFCDRDHTAKVNTSSFVMSLLYRMNLKS